MRDLDGAEEIIPRDRLFAVKGTYRFRFHPDLVGAERRQQNKSLSWKHLGMLPQNIDAIDASP